MPYLARNRLASKRALWTELALPGLVAFWDPQAGLAQTAGSVTSWTDLKSGIVASQATGANQFGYSATGLNGFPCVTGNGTSQFMSFSSGLLAAASCIDLACACSLTATSTSDILSGATSTLEWRYETGFQVNLTQTFIGSIGTSPVSVTSGIAHIQSAAFVRNSSTVFGLNGTQSVVTSSSAAVSGWEVNIGRNAQSGSQYFKGSLGSIVIASAKLSAPDRDKRDGRLAWRYGLQNNLPASHPYRSTTPTMSAEDIERLFDDGMHFRDARYRRELGLDLVERPKLYLPPRKLILPHRLAA